MPDQTTSLSFEKTSPQWRDFDEPGIGALGANGETAPDEPIAATGAWREQDHPGDRRFFRIDEPFQLECGGVLPNVAVAYETWGKLNRNASNAILLCHTLTGDSHAAGCIGKGHATAGWWNDLIGPGRAFDTDRYFLVCANVLGGCQGTTGPASLVPGSDTPWGSRFPQVTVRDCVETQRRLAVSLGIPQWLAVAGGSMGGMQALEWAVTYPNKMRGVIAIATTPAATAQQIAWSAAGRAAIRADANFRQGDFYGASRAKDRTRD